MFWGLLWPFDKKCFEGGAMSGSDRTHARRLRRSESVQCFTILGPYLEVHG